METLDTFLGKDNWKMRRVRLYKIKNDEHRETQNTTLKKLLSTAKNTEFGLLHDFKSLVKSVDTITDFRLAVPITDYDSFYESYLRNALNGTHDVIWPGLIKNYALSSGTTKAGSKYIPVSDHMLRQFKLTSFQQVSGLSNIEFNSSLLKSKVLIVGGSTELRSEGTIKVGDLSGILARRKSWIYSQLSKPGKKISKISDWNEKMDLIVKKAPKWNIGVIAGVPSWITLLIERIVKEHKLESIHEIWPNFQMYVHGGVFFEPYQEKMAKLLGKPVIYQNTFLASEGYFGYQKDFDDEYMELLIKHGVYYEFVEEKYFGALRHKFYSEVRTCSIDEVQPDKNYAMIISTCSGLWRYSLGDIISFKEKGSLKFKIVGRLSYDLNVCGEHLSEDNISKAVLEASKCFCTEVHEFCTYSNRKKDRHEWYIGVDRSIPESEFEVYLDEHLKMINDDYRTARKFVLKRPKVKALPVEKFYEYMSINNKIGAQNKFPRVMNERQVKHWESYLSNVEEYIKHSLG